MSDDSNNSIQKHSMKLQLWTSAVGPAGDFLGEIEISKGSKVIVSKQDGGYNRLIVTLAVGEVLVEVKTDRPMTFWAK